MLYRLILISFLLYISYPINAQDPNFEILEKKATYYHDRFENRKTSSGESFSQKKYTAAHKYLKLGSIVKITNKLNKRTVIVKINDRCPKKGVIDLTYTAAKRIGIITSGHAKVSVEILPSYFYGLWKMQDSIFELFDKYNYSNALQKVYQDSLILTQNAKFDSLFLWTYFLKIAEVKTFDDVHKLRLKVPEKYKAYIRIISINRKGKQYYKILVGPFMNKKETEVIKEKFEPIFKDLSIERNDYFNKN